MATNLTPWREMWNFQPYLLRDTSRWCPVAVKCTDCTARPAGASNNCGAPARGVSSLISPTCTFGPSFWLSCGSVLACLTSQAEHVFNFCVFNWLVRLRCFLNATLLLGEESFYSVMPLGSATMPSVVFRWTSFRSELPSSSSCALQLDGICSVQTAYHDSFFREDVPKVNCGAPKIWLSTRGSTAESFHQTGG